MDDMWAIDLGKLDGVKEIYKREPEDWQGSDEEDSEEEEDDEDEDDDEDDDSDDEEEQDRKATKGRPKTAVGKRVPDVPEASEATNEIAQVDDANNESVEATSPFNDGLPSPRPFESLRDFYARTSEQWREILLQDAAKEGQHNNRSTKEVRKGAFERAEEKWWDCREEIRALEDEQEEAGIGEVVSLADRSGADGSGGTGRRR